MRLDGLQAQLTPVPQEGTAALHGARPVPADPSLSSDLSSGPSRFGEMPPTSAAVSVLSEQYKMYCKCSSEEQVMDTYYAANGSAVMMRGETQVTVAFDTGSGPKKSQTFRLKCCIGAVSDTTLEELDPQGTFLAMAKELKGLTQVKAGRVMKEKEALDFCKKHGIKVITCRWGYC
eukprot:s5823_g1.t1